MSLRNLFMPYVCSFVIVWALMACPAYSQQNNSSSQNQDQASIDGTVVSSSRVTFVVQSDDDQFHLFTFDRNTHKPHALAVGTRVHVVSDQGNQPDARHATEVTVLDQAQGGSTSDSSTAATQTSSTAATPNASARKAAPLPPEVKNVEDQIQDEARRWRLGARAGVGLDPELILFGIHSQMGPIFSRNVFFRPNADFEWGEITDMVALNLEAVYRMRTTTRSGQWAPYFGAGPSLNFIHQSFSAQAGGGRDISFGNFDYQTGLNILMGVQNRHGTFFEIKTGLYSEPAPVLRLIVGKNF